MADQECVTINIHKTGTISFSGTKIVTVMVVKDGLEENLGKNIKPISTPEPKTPKPTIKIFDLHFPLTHTFEITGYLKDFHQVLTTSAVTSGNGKTINLETTLGLSVSDSLTIASPDGTPFETITVSSKGTNSIVADLTNNYPEGSLVTLDGLNPHTLVSDLELIVKDKGCATLVYRNTSETFAFTKFSFKDGKTRYDTKMSIILGEDLT